MKLIVDRLEAKWGAFEEEKQLFKQFDTSTGKKQSYLNVLFKPVSLEKLQFAKDYFGCAFHPSLIEFYEQYNGIMLFSESLRLYGIEEDDDALYDPYDIVAQNIFDNIQSCGEQFANFVVFGYYSSCLFCFDKNDFSCLYVVEIEQKKIVYKFSNVTELLEHYLDYLINEYDANGKKIHFDKSLEGLPIANVSSEFI